MAIIREKLEKSKPLTQEESQMLERAKTMPIVFDEDSPELTPEELREFRRVSDLRREERKKPTVAIRLSPNAYRKAKSLGKGYTSVLGRILEAVLNDNEALKQYL